MAVNCNKVTDLTDQQLEAKKSLAGTANSAVLDAMSDCYKAAQITQASSALGAGQVYLRAASVKFSTAGAALTRNLKILRSVEPDGAILHWLKLLDYDALYESGLAGGFFPDNPKQWTRLIEINQQGGYLRATESLIEDVAALGRAVDSLSDDPSWHVTDRGASGGLARLLSGLADFTTFAQMVAFLNALEPLDARWIKKSLSSAITAG
jgi:hypothetical protein